MRSALVENDVETALFPTIGELYGSVSRFHCAKAEAWQKVVSLAAGGHAAAHTDGDGDGRCGALRADGRPLGRSGGTGDVRAGRLRIL